MAVESVSTGIIGIGRPIMIRESLSASLKNVEQDDLSNYVHNNKLGNYINDREHKKERYTEGDYIQ